MKIYHMEQGTLDWLRVRAGVVTASELDNLVTPLWKPRDGAGVETYMRKKLAERWLGNPLETFQGGSMEQGRIREDEAIPWYEFETGVRVGRVGFISSDDGRIGCSPDGLLGDGGIEIKCPAPHTHAGYLADGVLPKEYAAQVHGSMLVTGAPVWTFLSYCRGFPALTLAVERDERIAGIIAEAVQSLNVRLDAAYARLEATNGGPPKRRNVQPVEFEQVETLLQGAV